MLAQHPAVVYIVVALGMLELRASKQRSSIGLLEWDAKETLVAKCEMCTSLLSIFPGHWKDLAEVAGAQCWHLEA